MFLVFVNVGCYKINIVSYANVSGSDCLEKLVSEMTNCVLSGTLSTAHTPHKCDVTVTQTDQQMHIPCLST